MERAGVFHFITDHSVSEAPAPQLHKDSLPKNEKSGSPGPGDVKHYHRIKLTAGLVHSALAFLLTIAVVATGLTNLVEEAIRGIVSNDYLVLLGFAGILGLGESLLSLPLRFYVGFRLEHRYRLSNQSFGAWIWERIKGLLVGLPLMSGVLLVLFFCLRSFGAWWWLPVGVVLFFFSVLLARIAPILIFPLFYTFKPLEDGPLKDRITVLCKQAGVRIKGIFVFNMSKTTKKANAAFTGIGKSKRIILGDTLVANFTDDEIESVFAHELGHYTLNHIWKMIAIGTFSTFAGLYLTAIVFDASLSWFGFPARETIAALPLLGLWLSVYSLITAPLNNMISRANERAADSYAVRAAGNKEAFVGALRKLGTINMADFTPHPLIEFLFYSHPSLGKRIAAVETLPVES